MSLRALDFEDFGSLAAPDTPAETPADHRESERLRAYDEGYATGWAEAQADARAAAEAAQAQGDALRARIEELGFTFQEARAHVMQAVTPMLRAILEHGLPQVLHATLGARLEHEFALMIESYGDEPMTLHVAATDRAQIAASLDSTMGLPLEVATDVSLESGQMVLAAGPFEHEIDIAAFSAHLAEILGSIEHSNKDLLSHG